MDSAYWVTWYDVPEDDRPRYLDWLHTRYMPRVTGRSGVLWGAHYECTESLSAAAPDRFTITDNPDVPRGTGFILIFGAEAAKVFLAPTVPEFHASLDADDRAMLELRRGARYSVMVEDDRVLGADAGNGPEPAPSIQLGSFDVPPDFEDEARAWFARARMPSMEGTPGAVRMRTMVAVSGWARHACLYEFTSDAARRAYTAAERGKPEKKPWTDRVAVRLIHMPGSPAVARRIWPPVPQEAAETEMTNQGALR